tara:strand:- start:27 stop:257 length:231 start_codon:yes stop_codon:yes gene_type:complete
MPLPPDLSKPIFSLMPHLADRILDGRCAFCAHVLTEFKDDISKKEYSISGMCQDCQDETFGVNGLGGQGEECEESA